jgi:hypothetical protein
LSETSNINTVLGILGILTGTIALFISWWNLRKERPRLRITVLKCEHSIKLQTNQVRTITFWVEIQIKNIGDRHTSVYDMSLAFQDNGNKYSFKKDYFRDMPPQEQRILIPAHDVVNVAADFYQRYQGNDKEQFGCTLAIYHTHKTEVVKTVSQRVKRNESET